MSDVRDSKDQDSPEVWGVVLAAGASNRWTGSGPKQLARFEGQALVRRAASIAAESRLSGTLVVVGFEAARVIHELEGLAVEIVLNPDYTEGQSVSVRAGLSRVPPTASATLFLPADQPRLETDHIDLLIGAYQAERPSIVLPVHQGRRGAPVLFDRSLFAELFGLTGDTGGRSLLATHTDQILEVEFDTPDPFIDVDTVEDLKELQTAPTRPARS